MRPVSLWLASVLLLVASQPLLSANLNERFADVLTLEEAAELLQVPVKTVELMAAARTIPSRRIQLSDDVEVLRFSREGILAWLENRRARSETLMDPDFAGANNPSNARAEAPAHSTDLETDDELDGEVGKRPEGLTSTATFLRDQSVVLSQGSFSLDVGAFYSRQQSQIVNSFDDDPVIESITRRIGSTQLVLRYSATDRTEFFLRSRADFQNNKLNRAADTIRLADRDTSSFVSAGLRQVLVRENIGRPELVFGLQGRVPTSTSSGGFDASLSLIKSFDPVVLFGSIAYTYIDSDEFDDLSLLDPKHTTRATIGYALAMNDRLSLNFALEAGYRSRTDLSEITLLQDDFAALQFGMTIKISPSLYVQPVVGYSLTSVGSAYTAGVNFPVSFGDSR